MVFKKLIAFIQSLQFKNPKFNCKELITKLKKYLIKWITENLKLLKNFLDHF